MQFSQRLRQERMRRHLSQEALAEVLGLSARSISRWEQGQAIPHGQVRIQLSRFFDLSPEELFADLETEAHPASNWMLPFPRNPFFTGREDLLETLHNLLITHRSVALTQSYALTELGGIGKTQVALEYAYRYAQEYASLFWLAAETTESLMTSLQQIANQLQLPERQAQEQAQMVAAMQRWLVTHTGWLVIADNVEDVELLSSLLPGLGQGALLVTTRRQALGPLAQPLELPPMSTEEGATLVLRRAKQLQASEAVHPQEPLPQTPLFAEAAELVYLLEGLPLALDQAGAYMEETGCGVADYVQRYHEHRRQILAHRGLHHGSHPASVATTLRLAIERVTRIQPAAAELLRACAFLYPEAIPEELFIAGASHLGSVPGPVVADPYQFDLVLAALRSASLVARHPETRTLSMHRLVQAVLADQMEPDERRRWSERVIGMVNAAFPEVSFDTWVQCERYLTQALACVPLLEVAGHDVSASGELLYKAGSYLVDRGRFEEAEPLLEQALTLGEHLYGSDNLALIPRLMRRAELFWRQGKYGHTEALLQRILMIGEQAHGPEHPQTAESLNNLAVLYSGQGRYEKSEPLYQQTLRIWEKLNPEGPQFALTLNNLALTYWLQGKYELAEALSQQALHIREQQLGPEHPDTVTSLNVLAAAYRSQEKYELAEPLYLHALRIQEQQLGPRHPVTASILYGLATVYRNQERYELAEPLYQQALHIREQQSGSEHSLTASVLEGLATLYRDQGKHEQSEALYQRALRIQEQKPDHPDIAITFHSLAILYQNWGKYELAEPLYQRALAIYEQRLPEHPQIAKLREAYHRLLAQRSSRREEGQRGS